MVYGIGRSDTVARMVKNAYRSERNTGLKERLTEYDALGTK